MGFAGKIHTENQAELHFWELSESVRGLSEHLSSSQLEAIEQFGSSLTIKRKKERLGVYCLLNSVFPLRFPIIRYSEAGQPFIDGYDKFISISHSDKYVVLMVSPIPCGVDIQVTKPNIAMGVDLFINEKDQINDGTITDIEKLHQLWCAKEALYKKYGGDVDFKNGFTLERGNHSNSRMFFKVYSRSQKNVKVEEVFIDKFKNVFLAYC